MKSLCTTTCLALVAALMALPQQNASGSLILILDDPAFGGFGDVVVIDDLPAFSVSSKGTWISTIGDILPGPGVVGFTGPVGAFSVNVSTGISKPVVGGAAVAALDLNSVDVSGAPGTLDLYLIDTDFSLPAAASGFLLSAGGTTDGVTTVTGGVDPGNSELLLPPGGVLGPFFGPGSFGGPGPGETLFFSGLAGPFSMAMHTTITHGSSGKITSFNANLRSQVPVPGTILLWSGLSVLGLAGFRRFRPKT